MPGLIPFTTIVVRTSLASIRWERATMHEWGFSIIMTMIPGAAIGRLPVRLRKTAGLQKWPSRLAIYSLSKKTQLPGALISTAAKKAERKGVIGAIAIAGHAIQLNSAI